MSTQVVTQTTNSNSSNTVKLRSNKNKTPQLTRIISLSELNEHGDIGNINNILWTSIDGIVYNINSFVRDKIHPGGSVIRLACGRDSTCLIESYHSTSSNNKIQYNLNNKCEAIGLLEGYTPSDKQFFVTVKTRVEDYLNKINMDKHWIQWISLSEAGITMILYLFFSFYVAIYGSYICAIILGLLTGRMGFLMHTGNHCAASHSVFINRILGYFMDLIGSTNTIWCYEHQVAHHMDPNECGKDNDCEIGNPFFRMHPNIKWSPFQTIQHVTIPFAISIGFVKWVISDFIHFFDGNIGNIKLPTTTHDWIVLFSFKSLWFFLHLILPWYYQGLGSALALTFISMVVGAQYLENTFIVNHIQHGLVPPHNAHWAVKQVVATANWQSKSHFWNFISGGLNHQIEHHLFPSVSTWLYPQLSDIVKQTCIEFGLPYFNYNSFSDAWWDMNNYLKALGQKDFTPEKYSSMLVKKL